MGFFRTMNKAKGFLNKSIGEVSGFGNKLSHGLEKGIHIIGKVANVADNVADKLENVPVIGGIAGEIKPIINVVKKGTSIGEKGLKIFDNSNKKFGKLSIK